MGRQEWRRGRGKETSLKRDPPHARGGRQEIRKSKGRPPLVVVRITLLRLGRGNCAIATRKHGKVKLFIFIIFFLKRGQ